METKTSLFIPNGYGKGTIIMDLENKPWIVKDVLCHPIYNVERINEEQKKVYIDNGAKLLISVPNK